jgi:hypothetical protein
MTVIIIDHNSKIVYHSGLLNSDALVHEMRMRFASDAVHYERRLLRDGNVPVNLPETTALISRENNLIWVDIVGDRENFSTLKV